MKKNLKIFLRLINALLRRAFVPLDVEVYDSKPHDSTIIYDQIDKLYEKYPILFNNSNILLGDGAYNSSKLKNKLEELKFGKLLTPINKRNTKDPIKINKLKLKFKEKMLLKTRVHVEHSINSFKQYKRINMRYDKQSKFFKFYVTLTGLIELLKKNKYISIY